MNGPISREEMIEMFGEEHPPEIVSLVFNCSGKMTIGELRAKIREIGQAENAVRPYQGVKTRPIRPGELERIKADIEKIKARQMAGMRFTPEQLQRAYEAEVAMEGNVYCGDPADSRFAAKKTL